jgi:hypothetical protein
MSQAYGHGQSQEPMVWERVAWRQGDGRYTFEVAPGGLHATLTSPHGGALTLPMVAWEGLLDALAAARKTKARAERNLPTRAGARWSEAESAELVKAFRVGGSIAQLARAHNRTQFAVEAHLDRLGLWDRVERRPIGRMLASAGPGRDGGPPPPQAYPRDHGFRPLPPAAPAGGTRPSPGQARAPTAMDAAIPFDPVRD